LFRSFTLAIHAGARSAMLLVHCEKNKRHYAVPYGS
jgi:hypothetical protein